MKTYPASHWQALGDWVAGVRVQAGYSDTKEWAAAVGRSTRMLLGLERGEPVGAKTIEAVAEALGVANWSLFSILDSGEASAITWTDARVEDARRLYESETGLEADEGSARPLQHVSDEDLMFELGRRLATRSLTRAERRMRELASQWTDPVEEQPRLAVAQGDEADADLAAEADRAANRARAKQEQAIKDMKGKP